MPRSKPTGERRRTDEPRQNGLACDIAEFSRYLDERESIFPKVCCEFELGINDKSASPINVPPLALDEVTDPNRSQSFVKTPSRVELRIDDVVP
jgi:hypothetical protein